MFLDSSTEQIKENTKNNDPVLPIETEQTINDPFFDDESIDHISIDETPKTESWVFEPLYRLDTNNNIRLWQVGFDSMNKKIRSRTGMVKTGNFTPSDTDVVLNNSGRTLKEQAMLESRRKYMDKYIEELYRPAGAEVPVTVNAALANEYEEKKIHKWPVGIESKLDGQRLLCTEQNGKISLRSRTNRVLSHITHLDSELSILFRYLPAGTTTDGEMYNHKYLNNQLRSIVSTTKGGTHPLLPTVEYYIFDIYYPENPPFEVRYNLLLRAYKRFLEDEHINTKFFILACSLAYNHDDIVKYHNIYVSHGYEGLIVRKLAGENPTEKDIHESIYRDTRTNNILKYKHFNDEEGTIIDVYDGQGKEKGAASFVVQDDKGNVFKVHPRGQLEVRKKWFLEPKTKFIGRRYTYRFFERTEYDIPRFPVGISLRDFAD